MKSIRSMTAREILELQTLNGLFGLLDIDFNELVNLLRFVDHENAIHLIQVYDSLSAKERKNLDLDMLAQRAGWDDSKLFGLLFATLMEFGIDCIDLLKIVASIPELAITSLGLTRSESMALFTQPARL